MEYRNSLYWMVMSGIIIVLAWLIIRMIKYHKSLEEKDVQLVQFYLDNKFLYESLVDGLNTPSPTVFCSWLIKKIKDYYNLEDLIIVDSISMPYGENNTILRNEIFEFIKENSRRIYSAIDDHRLSRFVCKTKNRQYHIYISRIVSQEESDGLIVCVENAPSLLSRQEKLSLENIINLLKTRLLFG